MDVERTTSSPRERELLEAAYRYVLEHGIAEMSLRPLASAIGSSPRVLVFLFGNKDGLVRALLARARADELALLARISPATSGESIGLAGAVNEIWTWLSAEEHRGLLRLWVEAYARSLIEPDGAWAGFAQATVTDWLTVLAGCQRRDERDTETGMADRTRALAILRGALLDLLATDDRLRVDAAIARELELLRARAAT
ncbi:DNA-binding transcriptional regulator, AcrR family [Mycolicibacterium rutilum]|uniref:DNA-binding transcriptional regulator, AcrR family n=1 Tax=Mycolicibacterium rutilum TaxID=370526 RepID=A0A1H6KXX9_MYCRU|nr:TetR/AcrR family transcriptional regulator [Mycolicibacterium rutilum]SEH76871.1 DNA-binding transcriptional regulator, AcrR family [Mycolicibacterium rutilum]